jgi:ferrous iron transport protein A
MSRLSKEEKLKIKEAKIEEKVYVHKKGDICPLTHLKLRQKGKIVSFNCENKAIRRRLLDMGLTKGCEVFIKQISPLGDPVNITLRGYDLCLRKSDLENIQVEVID